MKGKREERTGSGRSVAESIATGRLAERAEDRCGREEAGPNFFEFIITTSSGDGYKQR
jgi:hypothetical protein